MLIHTGPVELAAVGVSIALFNQVSRIAIFPLVSVTTSFVAEEDTVGRVTREGQESEYLESGSCINSESKELIPKNGKQFRFFTLKFSGNDLLITLFVNEHLEVLYVSTKLLWNLIFDSSLYSPFTILFC